MGLVGFGQPDDGIIQMAYVVPDVRAAMSAWVEKVKVGPWFLLEHFTGNDPKYRGRDSTADVAIAMSFAGHMNIELIQPNNEAPSVYREWIERRGYGFHHWGRATWQFDQDVERYRAAGHELVFLAGVPTGGRVAYMDTTADLPGYVELIELGGDEFVLVLGGLPDQSHVDVIMQKIFGELRGYIQLSGRTVYSTCSIGISIAPRDGTDSSTLLKHADLAMYAAKAQGGDSYRLFDDWMRPGTGRPTALEALLRWHHPTRGLVLPGVFIPIAEETGLIDSMGQWVLERACQDARAWINNGGEPLQVSVNLSPVQFAREDLSERVTTALAAAHLAPQMLELEITETFAMRSPELAARHLARLRILGVSLAIDDFGTGHSSLSRLKLLNVNCVKIDQSLIKDCTANAHDGALCRAAIALGLALGLEVVAEGVETEAQRQFLAQVHCSTIQGYLIARPMPAANAFALAGSLLKVPRIRAAVSK